jgi:hypothetical protein
MLIGKLFILVSFTSGADVVAKVLFKHNLEVGLGTLVFADLELYHGAICADLLRVHLRLAHLEFICGLGRPISHCGFGGHDNK